MCAREIGACLEMAGGRRAHQMAARYGVLNLLSSAQTFPGPRLFEVRILAPLGASLGVSPKPGPTTASSTAFSQQLNLNRRIWICCCRSSRQSFPASNFSARVRQRHLAVAHPRRRSVSSTRSVRSGEVMRVLHVSPYFRLPPLADRRCRSLGCAMALRAPSVEVELLTTNGERPSAIAGSAGYGYSTAVCACAIREFCVSRRFFGA